VAEKKVVAGVVQHPTLRAEKAEILLWGRGFRATYHGQIVDGSTYADVERQVLARMEAVTAVRWFPVIRLTLMREGVHGQSDGSKTAAAASVSFERFWFAPTRELTGDGRTKDNRESWSGMLRAPWECTTDAQRMKKAQNIYLSFRKPGEQYSTEYGVPMQADGCTPDFPRVAAQSGSDSNMLHYTDALWETLLAIVERLHATRAQLTAMVSTAESVQALEAIGVRLIEQKSVGLLMPGGS
jgi:hypothetical protein